MSIKFCIVVRPDTDCYLNEEFKEVWDLNEAKLYDTVECVQSRTNLKKIEWKDYWEVVEIYTLTENTYKKSRDVLAKQSMGVKVLDVILSAPRVDLSELRSTLDSLFFHQNYLTEILGITSSSNLELTRYIQLLTQANKKIHELQQELNLTAANQIDLKNASRQFVSNISTWWQNVGPGYVKDVQIKEGFAQATLSCAILDITDLFSTTAIEEPKQSVAKRLEALKPSYKK